MKAVLCGSLAEGSTVVLCLFLTTLIFSVRASWATAIFLQQCVCLEKGRDMVPEHLTVLYRLINSMNLFPIFSVCLGGGPQPHAELCGGCGLLQLPQSWDHEKSF